MKSQPLAARNRRFLRIVLFVFFLAAHATVARAQWMGRQTGCHSSEIEANPNRPTVANPADITQYGVLEVEYGWDRTWLDSQNREMDFAGLWKFGLLCDVEFRWTTTSYLRQTNGNSSQAGFGDNWLGPQIRIYRQTARVPSLAFSYAVKAPTASTLKGLGSGRVDHAITFLASKDIYGTHFDFNASYFPIGRMGMPGFDRNAQLNLSFSHPLKGRLGLTGEFYGNTELNRANPGFASTLWALTFNVSPRLVIDGGLDTGLTQDAPRERVFAGVTYSIANIYSVITGRKSDK